ncbi:MAG: cadmium-translocating P-type ATPase [Actinobacteria bacterium]|nr:cadmium-translocating P-type ATPase [Actinomycetota bacterium]
MTSILGSKRFHQALFLFALLGTLLGFFVREVWVLVGFIGLAISIKWLIDDFKMHTMGSDVLAVLSLLGTLITSEFFAMAIISLMLATGRLLESWAEGQAERELSSLLERIPRRTRKVLADGSLMEIDVDEIVVGDQIVVRTGEILAVDGQLLTDAVTDESALTGEPLPQHRGVGALLASGIVNAGSPFTIEAVNTAAQSTYAGIIALVREAQKKSAPSIRLANKWAIRFVPFALAVAGGAWVVTGEFDRAVAVLVAATPCPLILAVPIAVVSGLSQTAKHGAIIKSGAVLETLAKSRVVLLDKTGTLTYGGPEINSIDSAPGFTPHEVLQLAASIDQYSSHVVAQSIVSGSRERRIELLPVTDLHEKLGHSMSGDVDGIHVTVGQLSSEVPDWRKSLDELQVGVYRNQDLIGIIGLADPIRRESRKLLEDLAKMGVIEIAMLTGDKKATAEKVAEEIGIKKVYSELSPQRKLEITAEYMERELGAVVLVGDGINDAPALALADIGVAMGARGASAASEAADVVIVEDSIDRLAYAIAISKNAIRRATEAVSIGMGLSVVAMLAGALGYANASQGALIQEGIDVIAICWALTALRPVKK